jgi:hypothetical protein
MYRAHDFVTVIGASVLLHEFQMRFGFQNAARGQFQGSSIHHVID